MSDALHPESAPVVALKRGQLVPDREAAIRAFSQQAFAEGALPAKTKQLIAVAIAHATQCPDCIRGHMRAALRAGATEQELLEAIWVGAEMRAGGSNAPASQAIDETAKAERSR